MTPEEVKAARAKIAALENAYAAYSKTKHELELVQKYVKQGQVWEPTLCLHKAERYSSFGDVYIHVRIPAGVIQQSVLDRHLAAKRLLIQLGGTP